MMHFNQALESTAETCALCHDKCISACPVVESTRSTQAYPSRLAALALSLGRGRVNASEALAEAMQLCIQCHACTANCVYEDQPNDVTVVVRWARETLVARGVRTASQARLCSWQAGSAGSIHLDGSPEQRQADDTVPESIILVIDSVDVERAPTLVENSRRLVQLLADGEVTIHQAPPTLRGLWNYGYSKEALQKAAKVYADLKTQAPTAVVTLDESTRDLLNKAADLESSVGTPPAVSSWSEWTWANIGTMHGTLRPKSQKLLAVLSEDYAYREEGGVVRQLIAACVDGINAEELAWLFYPQGEILDIRPDPRQMLFDRIRDFTTSHAVDKIVVTHTAAVRACERLGTASEVVGLPTLLLDHLTEISP